MLKINSTTATNCHHASRWWMRAARLSSGTPIAAKARLKALEALPQIARFSLYAEQRSREIKLEAVSRETLRTETAPRSRPTRRKRNGSPRIGVCHLNKRKSEETTDDFPARSDQTAVVECDVSAAPLGYPISDKNAFDALTRKNPSGSSEEQEPPYQVWNMSTDSVKELRSNSGCCRSERASAVGPQEHQRARRRYSGELPGRPRAISSRTQSPDEAARVAYVNLRLDLLHRTHWPDSPVDPANFRGRQR